MSLAIDVDKVSAVLLADGWHEVTGASFDIDSYEFLHQDVLLHGGGSSGVCAAGFVFTSGDITMYGPLTAILAVRQS